VLGVLWVLFNPATSRTFFEKKASDVGVADMAVGR
jgi:hypothetical protein